MSINSKEHIDFLDSLNLRYILFNGDKVIHSNKYRFKDVKKALRIRNNQDIRRRFSPLKKHRNAIEIDTGKLNKQAMLAKMSKYVDKVIENKYGN